MSSKKDTKTIKKKTGKELIEKKPFNPLQPINPDGRPTVMTPDVLTKLREAFMFGCTDAEAAAFAKIGVATLYNYQNDHPEFLEQKNEWKKNPFLKARATIYNNLSDKDIAKWFLERKLRKEFAPSLRMQHSGHIGSDKILSDEEYEKQLIIRGINPKTGRRSKIPKKVKNKGK